MKKKFEDLKVGDKVYTLIMETVAEKTVTDIDLYLTPLGGSYLIKVEVDRYPCYVPGKNSYFLEDGVLVFADKESLVEALSAKVEILKSYIERYS